MLTVELCLTGFQRQKGKTEPPLTSTWCKHPPFLLQMAESTNLSNKQTLENMEGRFSTVPLSCLSSALLNLLHRHQKQVSTAASFACVPQALVNGNRNFVLPLLLLARALSSPGHALHSEEAEEENVGDAHLQQLEQGREGMCWAWGWKAICSQRAPGMSRAVQDSRAFT